MLNDLEQGRHRIALTRCERILKQNEGQGRDLGNALEMLYRHFGALTESCNSGGENQERRGSTLSRHRSNLLRLKRAIRVDPVNHGQAIADLFHGQFQNSVLFFECARPDFRCMRVDGDRTNPRGLGDVPDMGAITRLINAEVIKKGQ